MFWTLLGHLDDSKADDWRGRLAVYPEASTSFKCHYFSLTMEERGDYFEGVRSDSRYGSFHHSLGLQYLIFRDYRQQGRGATGFDLTAYMVDYEGGRTWNAMVSSTTPSRQRLASSREEGRCTESIASASATLLSSTRSS